MSNLLLPIIIPAGAGLLTAAVPARAAWLRTVLAVLGALGTFVATGYLFGATASISHEWMSVAGLDVDFALRLDVLSSWAVGLVGLLALVIVLYAAGWYRGRGGAPGRYYAWLLLATAGAIGVLLADNLLLLVLFWEVVTLMLFLLAASGSEKGGFGAAKAFAILGLADMALLVGVVLIGLNGTWSIQELAAAPFATGSGVGVAAFLLLLVAAMAKAGAMPFHSWIPTMSTGTHASVMAFLPGAVDKVLGIYLLVRMSLDWFAPNESMRFVVMLLGAITILGGVFMAMVQHDLRRLLSFHAVSQVGYMLLGIGTGTLVGVMGGLFHMANNALYKACLFLGAGSVEREAGTMELNRLGGLGRTMPLTFAAMFVASLAIAGIPPLNGFASKWLIYQSCVAVEAPIFLVAALFGSALTLASFVKVLHSVFWGARPSHLDGVKEGSAGIGTPIALVTLAALCIGLGVAAAYPLDALLGPVVGLPASGGVTGAAALSGSAATWGLIGEHITQPAFTVATFQPVTVTLLLLAGVLVALLLAYLGGARSRRVRGVFVGGQKFDRDVNRFSGTEFYRDVQEVPGLGAALESGRRGRLDLYQVLERLGRPVVRGLRRLHSGLVTDYLAWSLLGMSVVLAVLFWR